MSKEETPQAESPYKGSADTAPDFAFVEGGAPPTPPDLASEFTAGTPRTETEGATEPATIASIESALKEVFDPEIPVNIYDLGLIYEIKPNGQGFEILMTLTAPACPVAGILPQQVADAAAGVKGSGRVIVRLTWEPPWDWSRMSDDARIALGFTD